MIEAHAPARVAIRLGLKPISIEKLLEWAFGAEQVQLEAPPFVRAMPTSLGFSSLQNALTRVAELGCVVDTSTSGATFLAGNAGAHWDAETCAAVLGGAVDRKMAAFVAAHAHAGSRPTWMPGAVPKVVPAIWDTNQWGQSPASEAANPAHFQGGVWRKWMEEARTSRKAAGRAPVDLTKHEASEPMRRHLGRCTPIVYQPSAQQITRSREVYAEWWMALHELRERLVEAQALRSHALTREMPPEAPWIGGQTL